MGAVVWQLLLLAATSTGLRGQEPAEPPPAIPAEVVASVPFDPTSVFRDGSRLYAHAFSGSRLAVADLDAKAVAFRELPEDVLGAGAGVAAQGGRIFVSRRSTQDVAVFNGEGRLKNRFATAGPPSAIAVDHLGGIHVFSIFPPRQAPKALLSVYNREGAVLRYVGQLPDSESTLAARGAAMPMLRTDARGDVWAMLRGGETAIRVGISEKGQDVVDLKTARIEKEESEAAKEARQAREREIQAELEKVSAEVAGRSDSPKVTSIVAKSVPLAYSDFACGDRECVAVPERPLEMSERASSVELVVFDLDEHVETRRFELEGKPTRLVGILYEEERYALYALRGDILVRYILTGI